MNQPKQIQINCPHFRSVNVNGRQFHGCFEKRELITMETVNDFCFGAKCVFPILHG